MPALPQPSEPSSRLWPYDSTRREKVVPSAFQISYFGASATQVTQINNNMEQNEEKERKKKKKAKNQVHPPLPHICYSSTTSPTGREPGRLARKRDSLCVEKPAFHPRCAHRTIRQERSLITAIPLRRNTRALSPPVVTSPLHTTMEVMKGD
jgi:hypothetical protein